MWNDWKFTKQNLKIQINKISNLFSNENIKISGDSAEGTITLKSLLKIDDVWGPEAKIDILWHNLNREDYHHGFYVKENIQKYTELDIASTKKENLWHLSHELTNWYGIRRQMIKGRFYPSRIIHSIWYCDFTTRVFEVHAVILDFAYAKYEKTILSLIDSLQCHEV